MSKSILSHCEFCGKEFMRQRTMSIVSHGRFCSRQCFQKDRIRKHQDTRICIICKNQFVYRHSDKKKTCSKECESILRKQVANYPQSLATKSANGKRNSGTIRPRKELLKSKCIQCKKDFFITRHTALRDRTHRRFCSIDCWYQYIRDDPTHNHLWRGGYLPYYGSNWKLQSRNARKRDNFTCQKCGKYQASPLLDVHHIKPFRLFLDYREANQLSNLITLCKSCHSKEKK